MFPLASRAWRVEASTGGAGSRETLDTDTCPTPHPPHPRRVRVPPALCSAATRTHAADTRPPHAVSPARLCCAARTCLPWPGRGEEPGNFTKFYEITSGTNSINWSSAARCLDENNEMVVFKLYWMWTIISQAARRSRPGEMDLKCGYEMYRTLTKLSLVSKLQYFPMYIFIS